MACVIRCSRRQKICCGVTAIVVILLVVVLVVLFLTVFKPKEPIIIIQPVKLEGFVFVASPDSKLELNVTLGVVATVKNRNHGSFTYQDSTATVSYRGSLVGEAPINGDTVPDHGELNVSTSLAVQADEVLKNGNFRDDYFNKGVLNFTSASTLQGKVKILKIIKKKATSLSTCYVSVFVKTNTIDTTCQNKLEF
ncbi:late embryogenesis abundant protein At1g64065-like [Neltuma alba]|uniref:late embryogenesis abundant protein At1g64065-like n=1 Tax=Neltuma alba TaxID=207710 RepID=UPI0010A3894E|nr:late embryogenesis abundant protein At1g64065-like [Prosopis alba]